MSSSRSPVDLALSDGTPAESAKVAVVVGTILTAINQGDLILRGKRPPVSKVLLTYCVPFLVSAYGAVRAKQKLYDAS